LIVTVTDWRDGIGWPSPWVFQGDAISSGEIRMQSMALNWVFDGDGAWDASASFGDDGVAFKWRIVVCDDGKFDVSESDSELTNRKECFSCLEDAKKWCEKEDADYWSKPKQSEGIDWSKFTYDEFDPT
jgi:hypothetical protein